MKTIVTKSGFEALKERYSRKMEQLKSLREEKAIAYAISGDGWHDNPGWIQLGQQEELLAKELNTLQQKINTAILLDTTHLDENKVQLGCSVQFLLFSIDSGKTIKQSLEIVGSGESDLKHKKISYDSPMGQALCNMEVDEEKEVQLPGGKFKVKIQSLKYEII